MTRHPEHDIAPAREGDAAPGADCAADVDVGDELPKKDTDIEADDIEPAIGSGICPSSGIPCRCRKHCKWDHNNIEEGLAFVREQRRAERADARAATRAGKSAPRPAQAVQVSVLAVSASAAPPPPLPAPESRQRARLSAHSLCTTALLRPCS